MDTSTLFLVMDLTGVFAFALNGAMTALRIAQLDIVGVLTLGMLTALGGGMIRDIFLDALPPATFVDWRYLAVAASGALVAFLFGRGLARLSRPILVLDAAGLSLFAVAGALKGLEHGVGPVQAVILGAITAVGGGTLRDVLVREIPAVLSSGLYAVPAIVGALLLVLGEQLGADALPAAVVGAVGCFAIRLLGLHYDLHAPRPPGSTEGVR
ncbi:MAG TPA: trimeric intracellular cation channel family protein [Aeromicrobium sp.]|nr:trimeric intracellular cation channel family protein [Aeromicrobium sp.]